MTCVRSAWLTLDTRTIPLENTAAGYVCTSLDLGSPTVRDVVSNRPDQDGADDRTRLMGPRTVTANITALAGAGARIDAVASAFGPYMAPSARPTLHYVLDRPGAAERTIVLRAAGYAWPIVGADQRDIQLQWIAADPIVRDPVTQEATGYSGSTAGAGRVYPLNPPRTYPAGTSSPSYALVHSYGDLRAWPLVRVYGPITGPLVKFDQYGPSSWLRQIPFGFVSTFRVDVGHYVDIDATAKTARLDGDPTKSQLALVDWSTAVWPYIDPDPNYSQVTLAGTNTGGLTQVQVFWQDAYYS